MPDAMPCLQAVSIFAQRYVIRYVITRNTRQNKCPCCPGPVRGSKQRNLAPVHDSLPACEEVHGVGMNGLRYRSAIGQLMVAAIYCPHVLAGMGILTKTAGPEFTQVRQSCNTHICMAQATANCTPNTTLLPCCVLLLVITPSRIQPVADAAMRA